MVMTATQVGEKVTQKNDELIALLDKIGDEGKPSDEQKKLINEYKEDIAGLEERLDLLKDLENRAKKMGQPRAPEIPTGRNLGNNTDGNHIVVTPREKPGSMGFDNLHQFLSDVHEANTTGKVSDRLRNAAGSDEQSTISDPYGGFLAPPAFMPVMLQVQPEADPTAKGGLAPVFEVPVQGSGVDIPARVDKNHSTSVSGGLRVTRRAETQAGSSSRMEIEKVTLKPKSLFGLAYATEEILRHSAITMSAILSNGMRDEFTSEIFNEKINGTGAGELEGILNCPATISVPRGTSSSITGDDIIGMRQRAWRYNRCIWLANHDALMDLEIAHRSGTNADTFYFRAGSVIPGIGDNASVDIPDTLLGRPIVFTEYVPALGSRGDLTLWDPSQYLFGVGVGEGASGTAESIHVRFENHERTFKFWQENDGRCWWRSPLTPKNGANTLSPIVTLAT